MTLGISRGPQLRVELDAGERILHIARFHWILLLRDALPAIIIIVVMSTLALFRAAGGRFLETQPVGGGGFDVVNVLLLVLLGGFVVVWLQTRRSASKAPWLSRFLRTLAFVTSMTVVGALLFFRLSGGRVFSFDPFLTHQATDGINIILIIIALLGVFYLLYVIEDWRDNYLVITTLRVVLDEEEYLINHRQQQILISDVQQVNIKADSYLQHWLGYGNVVIRSYSPRTLAFNYAANPRLIQSLIQGEINKLRRQQEPELLRQLVEDQVYGNKPLKSSSPTIYVTERRARFTSWIYPVNPEINYQTETIIWRPSRIYVALLLARPFVLFWVLTGMILAFISTGLLTTGLGVALWIPVALICGGWIFWIRESYVHDVYVLNRQSIIDVDRRPFGPENRRQAALGAIQDVAFDINFFENILGFGTVVVRTGGAAGGTFSFNHVPQPRAVAATINDYLTQFRKREQETQLKNVVALLKQYHQAQLEHGEVFDPQGASQPARSDLPPNLAQHVTQHVNSAVQEELTGTLRREVRVAARAELLRLLRRRARRARRRASGA